MSDMKCPMDESPIHEIIKGVFEACPKCGREWYYLGDNLASKSRKVQLVSPIEEGKNLDDCIKPLPKTTE